MPDEPDHQNHGRGEHHQWEAFDQRVATADQPVFQSVESRAVEQVIRQRDGDEQQQWRLDHRGEDPGPANRQNRGDAARGETDGEHRTQFVMAGAGFDGQADECPDDGNHHRTPTGHSGHGR